MTNVIQTAVSTNWGVRGKTGGGRVENNGFLGGFWGLKFTPPPRQNLPHDN